ncbi:MAG TPA: hypothetical protein VF774_08185 [Pseudoduganella sp.]
MIDATSNNPASHPGQRMMRAAWRTGSHVAVREVEAPAPGPGQLLL